MRHIEGVTNRPLLRGAGLGDDAIDAMLARGELRGLSRGVYLEIGAPDDRRRRLIAALLTIGAPVAITDMDALWVQGHVPEPSGPVDLLLPHPRNPTRPRWMRIRTSTRFHLADVRRVGVVPTVSTSWAVTDVAKTSSRRQLARLVTAGIGARWVTAAQIEQVLHVRSTFPGSGRVRRLLEEIAEDHPYSGTERRLAARCRRNGMAISLNTVIRDRSGVAVARGDLVDAGNRLIIEVDGPHHWLPEVAAADRVRDRRLRELGWTVIRFTVYEIDADIDAVVAEVLAARAAQRAA